MTSTMYFIQLLVILISTNLGHSELDLIWQDALGKYSAHWFTAGTATSPQQIHNDLICPSSAQCVQMKKNDEIVRKVHLDIVENIKAYDSFVIETTATSPCQVAYKYDKSEYQTTEGPITMDRNAQILFIRLSASGPGTCYFDDVRLFGHMPEDNTIVYDSMKDILSTNWIHSNNEWTSAVCDNHHVYKSIPNVHRYTDIHIQFDVNFERIPEESSCQIWYRYDTQPSYEWYILRDIPQSDNTRHIVTIHEDPKRKQSSVLFIKFAHFANTCLAKEKSCCHFSNVYIKGRQLRTMEMIDAASDRRFESRIAPEARADSVQNVIIIGDMGGDDDSPYTTSDQKKVAEMMSTIANSHDINGIIALGDNIYDDGVDDEYDSRFEDTFEDVYTRSSIRDINWYFTSGNHDYRKDIMGEVRYTERSDRWNFPELYYTKEWRFGGLKLLFVALDTYILCGSVTSSRTDDCEPRSRSKAEKHWDWLEEVLEDTNADFIIVGGHTPIFSYASHGPVEQLIERLDPLLKKHNVNAHIFGHDHELQFIENDDSSLHYIGSGAGHDCRGSFTFKNSQINPGRDALKYMDCDDGGFVRLAVDTNSRTMKAYYYLGRSSSVKFTSGTWGASGGYTTADGEDIDGGAGGGGGGGGGGGDDDWNGGGGGGGGDGGDSGGDCIRISGFSDSMRYANGIWEPSRTYYKKDNVYLLGYDGSWTFSESTTNIDWNSAWCDRYDVLNCDDWAGRREDYYGVSLEMVSCDGSGGGSGGGGGSSGGDDCLVIDHLSKYNGVWKADGRENGKPAYYDGDDYWLFNVRKDGRNYWTISRDKGEIDHWDYRGWCSLSSIESCAGEWDYGDGRKDDNCEFDLMDCDRALVMDHPEPACLEDTDYLTTVCVYNNGSIWEDGYLSFELSHEECMTDKAVYYHKVPFDNDTYDEGTIYYLHFDNGSMMGEQWVISINETDSFGGAYCRKSDLLECGKGDWKDAEEWEVEPYTQVWNGQCGGKKEEDATTKWTSTVVIICILVLIVVIAGAVCFAHKYCAIRHQFNQTKKMVQMVDEDEDSQDGGDEEVWIEKETQATTI